MIENTLNAVLAAMDAEAERLDAFVEEQKRLGAAVRDRDWPGTERALLELEAASRLVHEAESARRAAWSELARELGDDPSEPAAVLALKSPEPWRSALLDGRRRLRVSAMRSRVENVGLSAWTDAARGMLGAALEELMPERRGRIYGRHGRTVASGDRPVVVDAAF